jgi:hypothetical protein
MRSGQRFSYLAVPPEETRAINAAYRQRIHKDQSNLIPLDPEAFIQTALELLAGDRYLEKGMGLMALTGRRPAEIFFSASFSLPKKKLPFPALIFSGQLKTPGDENALYVTTDGGMVAPYEGAVQEAKLLRLEVGEVG